MASPHNLSGPDFFFSLSLALRFLPSALVSSDKTVVGQSAAPRATSAATGPAASRRPSAATATWTARTARTSVAAQVRLQGSARQNDVTTRCNYVVLPGVLPYRFDVQRLGQPAAREAPTDSDFACLRKGVSPFLLDMADTSFVAGRKWTRALVARTRWTSRWSRAGERSEQTGQTSRFAIIQPCFDAGGAGWPDCKEGGGGGPPRIETDRGPPAAPPRRYRRGCT